MLAKHHNKKTKTKLFRLVKHLVTLLVLAGLINLQLAEAVTSGALYPSTSAVTGTVTNPNLVLDDDGQNAVVSSANSSLTAFGFNMSSSATSINSITFLWDISSYSGSAGDDIIHFEYSLDSGATWKTGSSYTTAQISSWTFPRLQAFTDSTNIPANWTQTDIANVRIRLRTVKTAAADGSLYTDAFYINVNYNVADSQPPDWPGANSLSAAGVGPTKIDLSWTNDATDNLGVTGWQIYRKSTSDTVWSGTPVYIAPGAASSYSDTAVLPGTSYEYRIRAQDDAGNTSVWSNIASAAALEDTAGPVWASSNSLNSTVISGNQVNLNWINDAFDDVGVTGWEIHRKLNSAILWPDTPVATAAGEVNSYSDLTASSNTSYDYRVRAFDAAGNASDWSNLVNAVTPDTTPPVVTWEMPANGSTGVLRSSLIKINFNKAMNTSTFIVGNTMVIRDSTNNSNITAGQLTFENENQTAVFDPADPLPATSNLSITVTTGVTDTIGNALAADYVWSFSTGTDVFLSLHGNFTSNDKACGICHITHKGVGTNLVKSVSDDQLCYLCHDAGGVGSFYTVEDDFNTAAKTTTHKVPVSQQCTDCHNPHLNSADTPKLLQAANKANSDEQFCWNCHGTGSILPTDAGIDHAGNLRDHRSYYPQDGTGHDSDSLKPSSGTMVKCTRCHEEHGSNFTKLLADPQGNNPPSFTANNKSFCYECHTNAIIGPDSGWDGSAVNDYNKGHGQNCTTCHDPHGTPNDKYNIFTYSMTPAGTSRNDTSFPYRKTDYNQCWNGSCHAGADTALTQTTKDAETAPTGFWQEDLFRNTPNDQRVNLHNFHLNLDKYRPGRGNATCKECHRPHGVLADENPDLAHKVGFPSSTVTANSLTSLRFDNLDSEVGDSKDGGSCNLNCHNYTHTDVAYVNGGASIGPSLPPGGQDCTDSCHSTNFAASMGPSSTLYRHLVDSPVAAYDESIVNGQTTCLSMCHTDHDIFNNQIGTSESPHLRSSGGSTSTPPTSGIPVEQVNSTCLSSACHGSSGEVNDPDYNSPSGNAATSDLGTQVNTYISGFHPINISLSNGPSNSYARGTLVAPWDTVDKLKCTDCHTQEASLLGSHASDNRYMLKRLGPQSYEPVSKQNLNFQLYDALCVMCHSQSTYGYGNIPGTGAGSMAPNTHKLGKHYTGKYGCMECHGGNPEFAQLAGTTYYNRAALRGSIHGWSYTYPGHTHPAEGFQNGLTISDYDPVDNTCTAQTGDSSCVMNAHAIQ